MNTLPIQGVGILLLHNTITSPHHIPHTRKFVFMKIDKLISVGNLPSGNIMVTTITNSVSENKRWRGLLKTIPVGVSKINDRFFFTILAEDAITFDIPHMEIQMVKNEKNN